jgi:prevent-host-death family protein
MTTVGAFEAKTHLSKLLERAEAGETIVITRHGKEVARLVPPATAQQTKPSPEELVAQWRETRKGLTLGGLKIKDLINEGRKY